MIVKKIPARGKGRAAARDRIEHAQSLVDYLRLPEKESAEKDYMVAYMLEQKLGETSGERLFHIAGRGFVSTSIEGQRAEMIAVADQAKRSPNPIDHWLLSWQEGELPSPEQVDEAVALFASHLGVEHLPHIYACHGDTHNRHVHIALNRFDIASGRMTEINDGWTLEAAHQAVALIVDRFGWQPEPEARYVVENGEIVLGAAAQARRDTGDKKIGADAVAYEIRTGYKSVQRIAQHEALPILRNARSWDEAHLRLAERGLTYDTVGTNGAFIEIDGVGVRASKVHRDVTRMRLEKRLGAFKKRDPAIVITPRPIDEDRFPDALRAEEYRKLIETHRNTRGVPPPNLESFYYSINEGELARHWRHRNSEGPRPSLSGVSRSDVPHQTVDTYQPFPCADGVRYARAADAPTAFVDRGDRIEVVAARDDAAILAALRLAAIRFDGQIAVRGSDEFRERVFAVAQRNGLASFLTDRDFIEQQDRAAREHERSREPVPAAPSLPRAPPRQSAPDLPASKPSSHAYVSPDHRQDPARQAHIEELIGQLERHEFLPLVRTEAIDADGKPVVKFELKIGLPHMDDFRRQLFRKVDPFDQDPAIQAVFERKHRHALRIAEQWLAAQGKEERDRWRTCIIDGVDRGDDRLAEAVHLLRQTPEVSDMLVRLEAHWAARNASEARPPSPSRNTGGNVTVTPVRLPTGARGPAPAVATPPLFDPRRQRDGR